MFLGCALALTACGGGGDSSSSDIAGPDANNNGVRDDVEAYINTRYLVAPQKAAVLQLARSFQKQLLVNKTDKPAVKLSLLAGAYAVHCVYSKFDGNSPFQPSAVVEEIESVTTNTKARLLAYRAFSKAADGTTLTIPERDSCE